jgi:hypothetical protein
MWLDRIERARPWIEITSHFSVIVGIVFVGYQFIDQKRTTAQERSLEMAAKLYDDRISSARSEILTYWSKYPMSELSGASGSSDVVDKIAMFHVFSPDGPQAMEQVVSVIEVLDMASACANSAVCDRNLIEDQIRDYAQSILRLYSRPISELRKNHAMPQIGVATEQFLEKIQ